MKEEIEPISDPYRSSFICSFGYKIIYIEKKSDRMDDIFYLQPEEGRAVVVPRRDFFSHVSRKFGNVSLTSDVPVFNPLISYNMFFNIQK